MQNNELLFCDVVPSPNRFCHSLGNPSWLCDGSGEVYFVRVDMVALDDSHSTWLLNELEFFGNADIHLECMGNQVEDLFDHLKVRFLLCCVLSLSYAKNKTVSHRWISSLFSEFSSETPVVVENAVPLKESVRILLVSNLFIFIF